MSVPSSPERRLLRAVLLGPDLAAHDVRMSFSIHRGVRALLFGLLAAACERPEPVAPPCMDLASCAAGQRQWSDGGGCTASDPCGVGTVCPDRLCSNTATGASCGRCLDDAIDDGTSCSPAAATSIGPYRVTRDHFQVWDGSRYRSLFVRGFNVGGARPGEQSDHTSLTADDWLRWFAIWADAGMNALRVYRVHPSGLYRALVQWNAAHPDQPLYLIQGVYYRELDPGEAPDMFPRAARFDEDVASAIDCLHGHCGDYPDVSPWILAWLIGREIGASEVLETNTAHPSTTSYAGTALSITSASATEAWVVERLDRAVTYERSHYAIERPIGFTNWLELDPLTHPTEPASSGQDIAQIDLAGVDASAAPAGHFVSYHAYPYFPEFVNEDPIYRTWSDDLGPDSYRAFLSDLRAHHAQQAVLIAEYGVPTSFAPAHPSFSGMPQGGIDEARQGVLAARMLRDIQEVGAAGGMWFQWEDGWWKSTWTSADRAFPSDDFDLWHDLLGAEQGYGMLAFAPTPSPWQTLTMTDGAVRSIAASFDTERVRFRIALREPLGTPMEIGLDVLDRHRGEPALPSGARVTNTAPELAVVIDGTATHAALSVTSCLDLSTLPYGLLERSTPATRAGGCGWSPVRWLFLERHFRPSGCVVDDDFYPLGTLQVRAATDPADLLDAVVVDASSTAPSITIELPWNLILVVDPATRAVFDDRASTPAADATVTDGIALAVSLDGELVETDPFAWPTWTVVPPTTERLKDGTSTFFEHTRSLPRWLD